MTTTYADLFAPRFILEAIPAGTQLDDVIADIVSMTYVDHSRGMDKVTFVLRNQDLKYVDDRRLRQNLRFKLKFGYRSDFCEERRIVIVRCAPSYPMGMSMYELTGYDTGRDLAMGSHPRNWGRKKSSEIASAIADQFGLTARVEDSDDLRRQDRIQPGRMTAYEYLDHLAHLIGWDFYVQGDELHFRSMATGDAPAFVYTYFRDGSGVMKSFMPDVKVARSPATHHANTTVAGTAASTRGTTANPADPRSSVNPAHYNIELAPATGNHVPEAARSGLTHPTPETNPRIQARHAAAHQTRIEMRAVTATIELIGQAKLRARQMITIRGVDNEYEGLWRVKESTHTFSTNAAYTTSAKLTRHGLNHGTTAHRVPANQTNSHQTATEGTGGAPAREINTERVSSARVTRGRTRATGGT